MMLKLELRRDRGVRCIRLVRLHVFFSLLMFRCSAADTAAAQAQGRKKPKVYASIWNPN